MDKIKAKLAEWSKDKRFVRLAAAALAVVLVLLVCLCISNNMRKNIHDKYSSTMDMLQEQVYLNLTEMTELFARVEDPNVDVPNKLLPLMKARYSTVAACNSVLAANGEKYALLSEELTAAFETAFEQYTTAYRQNTPTGLAKADLALCMEEIAPMVEAYNTPADADENKVVIIDAASGKIQNPEEQE